MHSEDAIVAAIRTWDASRPDTARSLIELLHRIHVLAEVPTERILHAVKDELVWLCEQTRTQVLALHPGARDEHAGLWTRWLAAASGVLHPGTCLFPRPEVESLLQAMDGLTPGEREILAPLRQPLVNAWTRHGELEQRVARRLRPPSHAEVQRLDPDRDHDAIHLYMTWAFRCEREFYGYLGEMRPVMAPAANAFFFGTGEFYLRAYKRAFDTHLLFDAWSDWGEHSRRGGLAIQRINGIHGRYAIPDAAFQWVLANLIYVAFAWNENVGWRPFSAVERQAWYRHHVVWGRLLNLENIPDTLDGYHAWWCAFDDACPSASTISRDSFENFLAQMIAGTSPAHADVVMRAMMAGMDDAMRRCLGYPEPSAEQRDQVRTGFRAGALLGSQAEGQPWFRSLASSPLYPHGARVDEVGVQRRGYNMPTLAHDAAHLPHDRNDGRPTQLPPITDLAQIDDDHLPWIGVDELARHDRPDDAWVAIGEHVYDITSFLLIHPGGQRVLRPFLGKDGTRGFTAASHSLAAQVLATNFRIGRLSRDG